MVCLPCIVIPFFLWAFHKYIQPLIAKYWYPAAIETKKFAAPKGKEDTKEYLYLKEFVEQNPVMIFSKTTCTFCAMSTDLLKENKIPYKLDNLDKESNMSELQDLLCEITGARTVPRIFIGQECVGGSSDLWTIANAGKLLPMVKAAGVTFDPVDEATATAEVADRGDNKKDN